MRKTAVLTEWETTYSPPQSGEVRLLCIWHSSVLYVCDDVITMISCSRYHLVQLLNVVLLVLVAIYVGATW